MSLAVNQKLQDRYEIVRSIKSGGMGAVYEAVDHKLASTPCAIKEVLSSALESQSASYILQSFESEMKALAALEHPNIPRVRDYFEIEGRRYIVLDLVRGQALDDELAENLRVTGRPLDPALAAQDMIQVLETLAYLHQSKPAIMHRDIKSANLIRDSRTGRIKVVDFGIARSVETQRVQTQVGTPGFCAPEQMAGRAECRSDLYSVGATLYHLCTGRIPPAFTFEALEMELPEAPGLVEIVLRATQTKPQDRYSNAQEMAEALKSWLLDPKQASLPAARVVPVVTDPPIKAATTRQAASQTLPPSNQTGLWLGILSMLLAASGLLYNDYQSRFAQQPEPSRTPAPTRTASPSPTPTKKTLAISKPVPAPVALHPNPHKVKPPRPKPKPVAPKPILNPPEPPSLVNTPAYPTAPPGRPKPPAVTEPVAAEPPAQPPTQPPPPPPSISRNSPKAFEDQVGPYRFRLERSAAPGDNETFAAQRYPGYSRFLGGPPGDLILYQNSPDEQRVRWISRGVVNEISVRPCPPPGTVDNQLWSRIGQVVNRPL
ncbi:protein kinase [bacterium]|nr:protein kinase [bacterium]